MADHADEWTLQGWYGELYGWEDLTTEDSRSEIEDRFTDYRINEPNTRYRIVRRKTGA